MFSTHGCSCTGSCITNCVLNCELWRRKLCFSATLFSRTCFVITFALGCCPVKSYTQSTAVQRISEVHLLQLPSWLLWPYEYYSHVAYANLSPATVVCGTPNQLRDNLNGHKSCFPAAPCTKGNVPGETDLPEEVPEI